MPQLGMGQCSFSSVHPSCSLLDISADTMVVGARYRLWWVRGTVSGALLHRRDRRTVRTACFIIASPP